jgi:hypothetical protein
MIAVEIVLVLCFKYKFRQENSQNIATNAFLLDGFLRVKKGLKTIFLVIDRTLRMGTLHYFNRQLPSRANINSKILFLVLPDINDPTISLS